MSRFLIFFKIKDLLNKWNIYVFYFPRRDFLSEACERRAGPHHLQPVLQNPVNTLLFCFQSISTSGSHAATWDFLFTHVSELHKIPSDHICSADLNANLLSLSKLRCMCCHSPQWKVPFTVHPFTYPFTLLLYIEHACSHVCRTVLLMNPSEVPAEFLSVAKQLTCVQHSQKDTYITLIKHAFQSTLGTKYPLHHIHTALQVSTQNKVRGFPKPEAHVLYCIWWGGGKKSFGHPSHFPQSQILSWNFCHTNVSVVLQVITDKWKQFSCLLIIRHNKKMRFISLRRPILSWCNSTHGACGQKLVTGLT